MRPFTQPWADAFARAVNTSSDYRAAANSWTWPLALVLRRAPELGFPSDVAMLLDLHRGECRSARVWAADAPEPASAPFRVSGDYGTWKRIIRGEVDPILAITRQSLQLSGSLAIVMLHARSAKLLVSCAALVPTEFVDENVAARAPAVRGSILHDAP